MKRQSEIEFEQYKYFVRFRDTFVTIRMLSEVSVEHAVKMNSVFFNNNDYLTFSLLVLQLAHSVKRKKKIYKINNDEIKYSPFNDHLGKLHFILRRDVYRSIHPPLGSGSNQYRYVCSEQKLGNYHQLQCN